MKRTRIRKIQHHSFVLSFKTTTVFLLSKRIYFLILRCSGRIISGLLQVAFVFRNVIECYFESPCASLCLYTSLPVPISVNSLNDFLLTFLRNQMVLELRIPCILCRRVKYPLKKCLSWVWYEISSGGIALGFEF